MRSCALRILLAATISSALVILRVFLILAILPRISFAPAITSSLPYGLQRREKFVAALLQGSFDFLGQIRLAVDGLEQLGVARVCEGLQARFRLDHLEARYLVEIA